MKTLIKNNSILIFIVSYFLNILTIFCQSDNIEIKKIINTKKEYCAVPLDFQLSFSKKVDKVFNIQNVKKGVNITGNNRVIINTRAVYLKGEDSKVYFSPEKSETKISKAFQKLMNIKLDSTLQKLNSLNQRIVKWDSTLIRFATILEKLPKNDPKKGKGIEILKDYKQNIETASCLNNDYGDKVFIKKDKKGNTDYLFDIEIIKKDPNYIYVGESVNGFRVIKKRNKYGYLRNGETDLSKVVFKYDYAEDFHKSGYVFAFDRYNAYIINNELKEIISYNNVNNVFITIINKNRFLVQGDKNDYLIDSQDKEIIKSNNIIKPADYSFQHFYVIDSLTSKELSKMKYGVPVIRDKEQINEISKSYYLEPNKKVAARLYIKDIDGNNVSKKIENDKIILNKFNVKKHNLLKASRKKDYDMIFLNQAFRIPNTNYSLYFFSKVINKTVHYVLKDEIKNTYINFSHFNNTKNITEKFEYLLYPLQPLQSNRQSRISTDLLIGYKTYAYYWINHDEKKYVTRKNYLLFKNDTTTFKTYKEPRNYIFNINQKRVLAGVKNIYYDELVGTINNGKTVIVHKKNDNYILKGAVDFNGLYIVPPFVKEMKYNEDGSFYDVITFKNDNVYELDKTGQCIKGECKDYNNQIKEYFNNN